MGIPKKSSNREITEARARDIPIKFGIKSSQKLRFSLRLELFQQHGELLRRVARFDCGGGCVGEFFAAFVVGVPSAAFDPVPLDIVMGGGEEAGSKLDKATKLGVKILTEAEFRAML